MNGEHLIGGGGTRGASWRPPYSWEAAQPLRRKPVNWQGKTTLALVLAFLVSLFLPTGRIEYRSGLGPAWTETLRPTTLGMVMGFVLAVLMALPLLLRRPRLAWVPAVLAMVLNAGAIIVLERFDETLGYGQELMDAAGDSTRMTLLFALPARLGAAFVIFCIAVTAPGTGRVWRYLKSI